MDVALRLIVGHLRISVKRAHQAAQNHVWLKHRLRVTAHVIEVYRPPITLATHAIQRRRRGASTAPCDLFVERLLHIGHPAIDQILHIGRRLQRLAVDIELDRTLGRRGALDGQ